MVCLLQGWPASCLEGVANDVAQSGWTPEAARLLVCQAVRPQGRQAGSRHRPHVGSEDPLSSGGSRYQIRLKAPLSRQSEGQAVAMICSCSLPGISTSSSRSSAWTNDVRSAWYYFSYRIAVGSLQNISSTPNHLHIQFKPSTYILIYRNEEKSTWLWTIQ
ncbi:hypothetical protein BO70DRAFT_20543 [Aspergillus heteromorphus CBS 117.55]|uniref:Uncharacterized protein n=1 Tax=Aspergillus heteromorphus CBS 117.55 TaxID=1448321 RepID=A0A317X2T3_9EURO|nr:uncharacterized protein BO70DRAFT_20543 [Aspergillus heteromorphus CBS 117.55]PWY92863.1 hypothetical protein BO70DRAFT_20543 [Aspergillus heteromorphus CBS 117.55]